MGTRSPTAWITDDTSTADLFLAYRAVLRALRDRGVVRTENAPTGDYAEYLAARSLGGALAGNSEKSYDIKTDDGTRYQVKARVVTGTRSGQRQLSPFRSWDFDYALIVLFDDDFGIRQATLLPVALVRERSTHRIHVNGYVLIATDEVMRLGVDQTGQLRRVAHEASSFAPRRAPKP